MSGGISEKPHDHTSYDFSGGFKVIRPAEALFRGVLGIFVSVGNIALFYHRMISFPTFAGWALLGGLLLNSGLKFQCGLVIRGLWNIDGTGYSKIPEEYREYAEMKKWQFLRDASVMSFVLILASFAYLIFQQEEPATTYEILALFASFIDVYVFSLSHILLTPAKTSIGGCG